MARYTLQRTAFKYLDTGRFNLFFPLGSICFSYSDHVFIYTDTEFLLRFLRYCKFSQLEARKRLDAYLSGVTKYADYVMDIDITHKGVLAMVKNG